MSPGEVSDAAVEAATEAIHATRGRASTTGRYTESLARAAITAALPHLSPRPDVEDEQAAENADTIAMLAAAARRNASERDEARAALTAVTALVERWRQEAMQGDRIAITLNDAQELQAALDATAPVYYNDDKDEQQ